MVRRKISQKFSVVPNLQTQIREQSKKQNLLTQTGVKQNISSLLSLRSEAPDTCPGQANVPVPLSSFGAHTEQARLGTEKGTPASTPVGSGRVSGPWSLPGAPDPFLPLLQTSVSCEQLYKNGLFAPCSRCLIRHYLTHRKTKRNLGEEVFNYIESTKAHEGSQSRGLHVNHEETPDWQPCLGMEQHLLGVCFLQGTLNTRLSCSRADFLKQPLSKGLNDWVWQRQHCHLVASLAKGVC